MKPAPKLTDISTRTENGVTVPFYADRDLSPEQIAKLPIHGLDPSRASGSLCGDGLPGRWAEDRALWTCKGCLAAQPLPRGWIRTEERVSYKCSGIRHTLRLCRLEAGPLPTRALGPSRYVVEHWAAPGQLAHPPVEGAAEELLWLANLDDDHVDPTLARAYVTTAPADVVATLTELYGENFDVSTEELDEALETRVIPRIPEDPAALFPGLSAEAEGAIDDRIRAGARLGKEWTRWADDPETPNRRLRIASPEADDVPAAIPYWILSDERATSRTEGAPIAHVCSALALSSSEVDWLWRALGDLLGKGTLP